MATILYGDDQVPLLQREWLRHTPKLPYRKTYSLKPGDRWHDAPTTERQSEAYVHLPDASVAPVGALVAQELHADGASSVVFTEIWGRASDGCVLMGSNLVCLPREGELWALLERLRGANGNRWRGLPDSIALFPDGRVMMREAKVARSGDKLSQYQHSFARIARAMLNDTLNLAVVEWGYQTAGEKTP
jgi:hypothetical protein